MANQKPFRFAVQAYQAKSAQAWRETAQQAESLGYSTFHLADHYFGPGPLEAETGHPVQDLAAIPAMAMAAEATNHIRIGCRVLCIDYHLPAVLAKEAATLDFLSDGRLELGLGAGWIQAEYDAMGVAWDAASVRIERLAEVVTLVKAHFGPDPIDVSGRHLTVSRYTGVPRPVQHPRPPIMIGGGAERILGLAGREADIVSLNYNNARGRLGPASIKGATAESTDQKIEWVRAEAGDRFAEIELEIGASFVAVTNDATKRGIAMAAVIGMDPADFFDHPHVLVGSTNSIVNTLIERRERYGISYVTVSSQAMQEFAPVVDALSGQ
jgi:probable F420-dependent oxidoreductase